MKVLRAVIKGNFDEKLTKLNLIKEETYKTKHTIKGHKFKINDLENYTKRKNLIHHCIPEITNGDAIHIIVEMGKAVGMQISPNCVARFKFWNRLAGSKNRPDYHKTG